MSVFYKIAKAGRGLPEWHRAFGGASVAILLTASGATAADLAYKAPPAPALYDWNGFYFGEHTGYAWGNSNWTASAGGAAIDRGFISLAQGYDANNQGGSWFNGIQLGYNRMFSNRIVVGVEADGSVSSFPNYGGNRIGNVTPAVQGTQSYSDNIFSSGTFRGRIGYAPGNWLFYATGGVAWTSAEQFQLTTANSADSNIKQRTGWAAGVGVEGPLIPHWTVKAEYLYTNYLNRDVDFSSAGERFTSNLTEQEFRVGLNYHFGEKDSPYAPSYGFDPNNFNIHAQTTWTWQGYPAFHSAPGALVVASPPFLGFPSGGEAREIGEATLYLGYKLPWKGAELWIDPEIDQGLGVGNSIGVGAYVNGEAFKIGSSEPYAKIQRVFVRQTIDLGGDKVDVPADLNQFAQTTTSDRLVLTFGRMSPLDVFDQNKYANNPKSQFLNWGLYYALPFDWGGDAWGYGWGATAEWYTGRYTFRLGWFDTEKSAIADNTPTSPDFGVDPTFKQYDIMAEFEERHELWGQPGKFKFIVNLISANLGTYGNAIIPANANSACATALAGGVPGFPALACVRNYTQKVDAHINIEQGITQDIGVFSRIGWAPGYIEDLAVTDSNLFISGGVAIAGRSWGRPADTIGIGYVYNRISQAEQQYLALGGLGSFVGDGQLANPRAENVLEAYYNLALNASTNVSFDYQLFANPGFNGDRGPVNLFATRIHWQY